MTNRDESRPDPRTLAVDHDQPSPGLQADMRRKPQGDMEGYRGSGKLDGQVAIVTGGDSGIGRAVALAFAAEGARVAIAYDQSDEDAEAVVDLIARRGGEGLRIKADVTSSADRVRIVEETVGRWGRLDVLVNNAAYFEGSGPIEEVTEAAFRKTYETNVFAYAFLAQAALPHLLATKGAIINTSSTTSILGKKRAGAYSSSKGAVNVLTKVMALELGPKGVRVNAVLPGPFWTPAIATSDAATVASFGSFATLGRPGQPDEIAPAYVLLAADSGFISGTLLEVSGGFEGTDD